MPRHTVVIPIYPDVTQLDFTGPSQAFIQVPDLELIVASVGGRDVASADLTFTSLAKLEDIERCDVLCVPGGDGCLPAAEDPVYMAAIRRLAGSARYITSVCTGSLILGATGLLSGKRAACHWASRHLLSELGAIPDPGRVVRDGNVITGGGITAGIDFALTVIAELCDQRTAEEVQLHLEYAPDPPFDSGRPETAPPEIVSTTSERMTALLEDRRERLRALPLNPA